MNMLVNAMQVEVGKTRTTNGMQAYSVTGSKTLDLFGKIGDARKVDLEDIFKESFRDNEEVTVRMLLWARDVRGGAGERETFRKLLVVLAKHKTFANMRGVVKLVPEVGRWDDLFVLFGTRYEQMAIDEIKVALLAGNGLCAKWMPRKGVTANQLRTSLGWTPKFYRKTLVNLTNVVETKMCNNEWTDINYEHVPSKAIGVYARAFGRHDQVGFSKFKTKVETGEAKINARAVFPYDVVNLMKRDPRLAEVQWKALPDYVQGSDERAICVVDVSGSMMTPVTHGSSVQAMDVAISLGIYTAERIQGAFHNSFITFTDKPQIVTFSDNESLKSKIDKAHKHDGYSTNLEGVFNAILNAATLNNVPANEMPTKIVIISDAQFDAQVSINETAVGMIKRKFKDNGYEVPDVVFWNCNAAQYGNTPVTKFDKGVAMVSGFSPRPVRYSITGD